MAAEAGYGLRLRFLGEGEPFIVEERVPPASGGGVLHTVPYHQLVTLGAGRNLGAGEEGIVLEVAKPIFPKTALIRAVGAASFQSLESLRIRINESLLAVVLPEANRDELPLALESCGSR